jgi:hypothetical protein
MSSSVGSMKLTLAAAVATAVASWACYASAFGNNAVVGPRREMVRRRRIGNDDEDDDDGSEVRGHFEVPPEILEGDCECREEVVLAVRLALEGE